MFTLAGPGPEVEEAAADRSPDRSWPLSTSGPRGAHPRLGTLDVVPWVPLAGWPVADGPLEPAVDARDRFARWAGQSLGLPCFLYGPERSLPQVRREAWRTPQARHRAGAAPSRAGAAAVGARPILVAYNLWLAEPGPGSGPATSPAAMRGPPFASWPCESATPFRCRATSSTRGRLAPRLPSMPSPVGPPSPGPNWWGWRRQPSCQGVPAHRWRELDLDPSSTIEARLEQAGLGGGSFLVQQGA